MNYVKKLWGYLFNKNKRFKINALRGMYSDLPDEEYLRKLFYASMGKPLDLENPQTFNEKLQWLKLYDRKPIYTTMVDKYAAKEYAANLIGKEHIIPTLGVWDRFDDIDFDALPDRFVLKTTHDSGGVVICRDKKTFDKKAARAKLEKSLKRNYYLTFREWPYQDVPRKILAEQYMEDESGYELKDYKFFCFWGKCKCFKVDFDRFVKHRANYYDRDKKLLYLGEKCCPPDFEKKIKLPTTIDEMIDFSEILSRNVPFLRVDLYSVNEKIYFGELTFYPASGIGAFTEESWDQILGDWIVLPEKTKSEN